MPAPIVELVPNFSEGRDAAVIDALAAAVAETAGVVLLDRTSDPDHHRTVLTIAGEPAPIVEVAVKLGGVAAGRIDLRRHQGGVHPRLGVMDVCPLIPVSGQTSMEHCAELAQWVGNRLWLEHSIPVYFYEAAALREECRKLEDVRREAMRGLAPDLGGPAWHPSAGVSVVGARQFLIAFNVNLATDDLSLARRIARSIRASSGGLPAVKALGFPLASEGLVQVSMNLVDYTVTGIEAAFTAIESAAREAGVGVRESELIGLAPAAALNERTAARVKLRGWSEQMILENRLSAAGLPQSGSPA